MAPDDMTVIDPDNPPPPNIQACWDEIDRLRRIAREALDRPRDAALDGEAFREIADNR